MCEKFGAKIQNIGNKSRLRNAPKITNISHRAVPLFKALIDLNSIDEIRNTIRAYLLQIA